MCWGGGGDREKGRTDRKQILTWTQSPNMDLFLGQVHDGYQASTIASLGAPEERGGDLFYCLINNLSFSNHKSNAT